MIRHYLWLALIIMATGTMGILPMAVSAQVSPNIRYVDYNPDAIIRLTGHTGYQMMLEFEAGEQIETVGIGDSSGWQVTPNGAGTVMFLKPVGLPPATNLSIITNLRRYNLELLAMTAQRPTCPNKCLTMVKRPISALLLARRLLQFLALRRTLAKVSLTLRCGGLTLSLNKSRRSLCCVMAKKSLSSLTTLMPCRHPARMPRNNAQQRKNVVCLAANRWRQSHEPAQIREC